MTIANVIRRARRRLLWNEIAAQGACALSVTLGTLVLLLLLGAQILDWRWLIALPAAVASVGAWRTVRRLPGSYSTAQLVDRRLKLSDTLSTALFFSTPEPADPAGEAARQAQRQQAQRLSENLNPAEAVPFAAPRAIYAAAALAFTCAGLLALRYGVEHRLNLQPSLAHILKQAFGAGGAQMAELRKKDEKDAAEKRRDAADAAGNDSRDSSANKPGDADKTESADASATAGKAQREDSGKRKTKTEADKARGRDRDGDEQADGGQSGEAQDGADAENSSEGKQSAGQQSAQQRRQAGGSQSSASGSEQSGVLSRLRQAMQDQLARMKRQLNGLGSRQTAMSQNGREGRSRQGSGENGRSSQGKQQGGQDSGSQEGQQGGDAQNAQSAQGSGAGQNRDDQAGKQPGSGIGNQDGDKNVKLAEQLAAMGKISEIIGKRSADVTGDITVEVQSGNQQLITAYTQKSAEHTNAGGEINRDEVPLLYQAYVQRYFEEVRKQPAPVAAVRPGARSQANR